jgi:nitrate reductase NapE
MQVAAAKPRKWRELLIFAFLSVMIWPFVASAFVATYGLAFWIYFMLAGPPGSH